MQAGGLSVINRQIEAMDVDLVRAEYFLQLSHTRLIGAKTQSDQKRLCIEPNAISRFDSSGRFNRSQNGDLLLSIKILMQFLFAPS